MLDPQSGRQRGEVRVSYYVCPGRFIKASSDELCPSPLKSLLSCKPLGRYQLTDVRGKELRCLGIASTLTQVAHSVEKLWLLLEFAFRYRKCKYVSIEGIYFKESKNKS